jgi:hypothetical protein
LSFAKTIKILTKFLYENYFSYIWRSFYNCVFLKLILKIENLQNIKTKLLKLLNLGSGTGSGFENFPKIRVLGSDKEKNKF